MKTTSALIPICHVSLPLVGVLALLAGCSNPLHYQLAKLTDQQRTRVEQILTADQLKRLDAWIDRNSVNGKPVPPGVTVEQALSDQEAWLAKQKVKEAKDAEIRKKAQADRAAIQEKFASMLSVVLISKRNKVQADDRKVVTLEMAYTNKADKDIQRVTGVLRLTDIYGDGIIDIEWSHDGRISAKQIAVEHNAVIPIEKSMEPQMKLWNTDFERLKSTFEIDTIVFQDGSSVKDPG